MDENGESFNCVIAEVPRLLLPILNALSFSRFSWLGKSVFWFPVMHEWFSPRQIIVFSEHLYSLVDHHISETEREKKRMIRRYYFNSSNVRLGMQCIIFVGDSAAPSAHFQSDANETALGGKFFDCQTLGEIAYSLCGH